MQLHNCLEEPEEGCGCTSFSCGLKCWTNSTDRHHHPQSSTGKNSSFVHLTFFILFFIKTKRCFSSEKVLFLKWSKWKLSCSYCLFVFKTWTRVSPCCRGKKNKGDPVSLLLKNTSAAATAWHVSPPTKRSKHFWSWRSGHDTRLFIQRPSEFHAIRSEHVFPPSAF